MIIEKPAKVEKPIAREIEKPSEIPKAKTCRVCKREMESRGSGVACLNSQCYRFGIVVTP
jgi:hypothetical protein